MHAAEAMELRAARRAFLTEFPGRLLSLEQAVGKVVLSTWGEGSDRLVLFADGTFFLASDWAGSLDELQDLLLKVRSLVEPHQREAFAALEALQAEETEAMRLGRMEKILGAVAANLPQIPELREALLGLLGEDVG